MGDCESRNAGTRNGTWNRTWNGSMKVKFSVRGAKQFIKIGSGKLSLALVCVRELQKLAIVAMKSLSMLTEGVTGVVKTQLSVLS